MLFHYIASQQNGKTVEGDKEAFDTAELLGFLASQGLKPISIRVVKGAAERKKTIIFGQAINVQDKIFLTKYLALMLKVGTDLFKAIDILIADLDKPSMKVLLLEIRSTLEKGQPFFSTFTKYPKYFSPVFVNLIRAGELSGNLERSFMELSVSLQKELELRNKIKSALTYPIILLAASFIILILLFSFALPKIAEVFSGTGSEPPTFSKIVFAVGLFFGEYVWFILAFIIIGGVAAWIVFGKTVKGKAVLYRFFIRIPLFNKVLKKIALQRFAYTLASLLKSGLPLLDSIEITADTVGFEELKRSLLRIAREGITKGLTIGEAFKREEVFPRVVVNLVALSEKAGHLEDILGTLSNFYESEIESSIKTMVTFLEPMLLLGIGVVIGIIALAIIIPIYQLVGSF